MTKKFRFKGLELELTRRCNLKCAHCMRGEQQNLTISKEIIDALLSQTTMIDAINISGGEPFIALDELEHLLKAFDKYGVRVERIGIITNGTIYDERAAQILLSFAEKHPECWIKLDVSADKFHEGTNANECVEFYQQLCRDRIKVGMHAEDIDTLIRSGRAAAHKSINGIPVGFVPDGSIRPHRIKIVDETTICCRMRIGANGDLTFDVSQSFDVLDRLAIGNIMEDTLEDIIFNHNSKCVVLCNESYNEIYSFNQKYDPMNDVEHELLNLYCKVRAESLKRTWSLRKWVLKSIPNADVREVILGTIFDDDTRIDAVSYWIGEKLENSANLKKYFQGKRKTKETINDLLIGIAKIHFEAEYCDRFPTASADQIEQLCIARYLAECLNMMSDAEFRTSVFAGRPIEPYFLTVAQRLNTLGFAANKLDECMIIPGSISEILNAPE